MRLSCCWYRSAGSAKIQLCSASSSAQAAFLSGFLPRLSQLARFAECSERTLPPVAQELLHALPLRTLAAFVAGLTARQHKRLESAELESKAVLEARMLMARRMAALLATTSVRAVSMLRVCFHTRGGGGAAEPEPVSWPAFWDCAAQPPVLYVRVDPKWVAQQPQQQWFNGAIRSAAEAVGYGVFGSLHFSRVKPNLWLR